MHPWKCELYVIYTALNAMHRPPDRAKERGVIEFD
jgi:hypothetical protein